MPPDIQGTSTTAAFKWIEQPPGTTASSLATGHPAAGFGIREMRLVTPQVQDRVSTAFERALASGREADWERFVERTAGLVDRLTEPEFYVLANFTRTVGSNYRPAAALARTLGAYAAHARWRDLAAAALASLLTHRSPEVRLQVLEAAADADAEVARSLATLVRMDPHEDVRNLSRTIISAG